MKIQKSNQKINPFGGINFVANDIRKKGVLELIDNELGIRGGLNAYNYSEIFMSLWLIFFCGGDCAEDIAVHLAPHLKKVPGVKAMSADTVLKGQKELATDIVEHETHNAVHQYNDNAKLNSLLLKTLILLGYLKVGGSYDFDFDHQVIPNEKYDSKKTYKKCNGYFPGIAMLNNTPFYIENRNGNSNVKFKQEGTLKKAFELLSSEGIGVNRARMDCGSYAKDIINEVEKHCNLFYIRAMKCDTMREQILSVEKWHEIEINYIKHEVASVKYAPFGGEKTYRLVIMRTAENQGQGNLFTEDARVYRSILTNDIKSTEKEVIEYYNKRGESEKVFDEMNNDFGWGKMPFSFLNQNTVFLIIMAICRGIYKWLVAKYSQVMPFLESHFRIKKFIFRFISVPAKWIKHSGKDILKIFSKAPYELLV